MIALPCPDCGQALQVPKEWAGQKSRCPHCRHVFVVPAQAPVARRVETPAVEGFSPEVYDFLAPPQAADEIGRLGAYRILRVLGVGGMGVVFLAEDPRLERMLALKAMLPALAASGTNKERFLREARAAAGIEHDHIIAIYEVGEERGIPFMVMPFLRGQTLEERLRKEGKLPVAEALRIARETADGLAAAHEHGLIHRDIKPANIFLEGDKGRVKILDFGLARRRGEDAQLTQQGVILGTPAYMAPEQASGKKVDSRCDLFSLGCVLYRLTTGQLPFQGADAVATLIAVTTTEPPPPRQLNPNLPEPLSRFILHLLAKNPIDRPLSAHEVVAALDELPREPVALSDRPSGPVALGPVTQIVPDSLSHSWWPWFIAGAGLGVIALALVVAVVLLVKEALSFSKSHPETTRLVETAEANPQAKPQPAPEPDIPAAEIGNDRAVAEWAVSIGGTALVWEEGARLPVRANNRVALPKGHFYIHQLYILDNDRVRDHDLRRLAGLERLECLLLNKTPISDAGLDHLRNLPKLLTLEVKGTRVTEDGVRRFHAAVPQCLVRDENFMQRRNERKGKPKNK